MLSVDLAFESVLEKTAKGVNVTRFCAEHEFTITSAKFKLEYHYLANQDQLRGFDKVLYWGDFHHWIGYANGDWLRRWQNREPSRGKDEIIDAWYKRFLLEGAEDIQKRASAFGGTLYGLNGQQLRDRRYGSALASLYGNSQLVLMRDHVSANFVEQLTPRHVSAFGCDCAFLLDSDQILSQELHRSAREDDPYMVCSFGRSEASTALQAFATILAAQMKLRIVNLDWLGPQGLDGLMSKLIIIKKARYVITDIYHLSVTSWRENVPALCIGKGGSDSDGTLSDKKKEILYRQIFASDKYLYTEDVLNALGSDPTLVRYCAECIEAIEDEKSNEFVCNMVERQKRLALSRLLNLLDGSGASAAGG
ncbi:MAG: hypothetical protein QOK29_2043 [Rhodospirillaceae bacterium]|nr:hypothetical protein [Rhodospirillaceae bacterium]